MNVTYETEDYRETKVDNLNFKTERRPANHVRNLTRDLHENEIDISITEKRLAAINENEMYDFDAWQSRCVRYSIVRITAKKIVVKDQERTYHLNRRQVDENGCVYRYPYSFESFDYTYKRLAEHLDVLNEHRKRMKQSLAKWQERQATDPDQWYQD